MKASFPTIAIFLLLVCSVGNNIAMCQTVGIEKTLQVFNVIFDTCNFDSRYYVVDSKPTFIILKEGPIIDMADSLGFVDDVLQLANGNKIVINSKGWMLDRKSTRLNSSHVKISYAVFCLKKKKN